jgi:hypothetical protein
MNNRDELEALIAAGNDLRRELDAIIESPSLELSSHVLVHAAEQIGKWNARKEAYDAAVQKAWESIGPYDRPLGGDDGG